MCYNISLLLLNGFHYTSECWLAEMSALFIPLLFIYGNKSGINIFISYRFSFVVWLNSALVFKDYCIFFKVLSIFSSYRVWQCYGRIWYSHETFCKFHFFYTMGKVDWFPHQNSLSVTCSGTKSQNLRTTSYCFQVLLPFNKIGWVVVAKLKAAFLNKKNQKGKSSIAFSCILWCYF